MYLPSLPTFCAVPVFPPILYPSMYALCPLPFATTLSSAYLTRLLVSFVIKFSFFNLGYVSFMISPVSLSLMLFITYGVYIFPSFIILLTAKTCCIAVTETPWPKLVVASSSGPTLSKGNIIPLLSPFRSIPVFLPKPNLSM